MNTKLQNSAALAGRSLLALIFLISGFGKVTGFAGTVGYIASKGMPLPELLAAGAAAVELLGGLALVLGWKTRWAAAAIALFLIPTTLIFHNPAGLPAAEAQAQVINFLKNISIFGGMLMLVAFGPGRWSIDKE
ncbi:MAG: DoxX family protein [Betaproteobacteria bacterium]|nr:DoxX family protein [Betaproteobacteria bacterium]